MRIFPDIKSNSIVKLPGLMIVAVLRRSKTSLIYQRSWNMLELHLMVWWFSAMIYLAGTYIFLSVHCGATRTDLVTCSAKNNIFNIPNELWPSIVSVLDTAYVLSCVLSGCMFWLISSFAKKKS